MKIHLYLIHYQEERQQAEEKKFPPRLRAPVKNENRRLKVSDREEIFYFEKRI